MAKVIEVLVVDDSPLFSEAIRTILEGDPCFRVVGLAAHGRQAVEMTQWLKPDIITMDVHMPVMNGLEAIERIMADSPTPILVVTSDPKAASGEELHFEALRRGALDVFPKPTSWPGTTTEQLSLRERLKLLSRIAVVRHLAGRRRRWRSESRPPPPPILDIPPDDRTTKIVAFTASTGGPAALAKVFESLPNRFPAPILITQHITKGFAESFASWLNDVSGLDVQIARHGSILQANSVFVSPNDFHITVSDEGKIRLEKTPPVDGHRPSGTPMFNSIARVYGSQSIGIILSGMGRDGVQGLKKLREVGGVTLAQDEQSCVVYGMPKVAMQTGAARHAVTLEDIPQILCRFAEDRPVNIGQGFKAVRRERP